MDNNQPVFVDYDIYPDKGGRVLKCARCRGEHPIMYRKFKVNKVDGYDKWAMCPELNEPILIKITTGDPIEA